MSIPALNYNIKNIFVMVTGKTNKLNVWMSFSVVTRCNDNEGDWISEKKSLMRKQLTNMSGTYLSTSTAARLIYI
jgi:hypothetical protein